MDKPSTQHQANLKDAIRWWEDELTCDERSVLLRDGWPKSIQDRHDLLLTMFRDSK